MKQLASKITYVLAALPWHPSQNVRYRSESDAYEMADEVCKDLESTAISKTQSGREQWAHSMLVLHRDLSDRDATTLITATQNSKMCLVK